MTNRGAAGGHRQGADKRQQHRDKPQRPAATCCDVDVELSLTHTHTITHTETERESARALESERTKETCCDVDVCWVAAREGRYVVGAHIHYALPSL